MGFRVIMASLFGISLAGGSVYAPAQESHSAREILQLQQIYFQQLRSAEFSFTTTAQAGSPFAATEPITGLITWLLDGERYWAQYTGWDRSVRGEIVRESAFDGDMYAKSLPDGLLLVVRRRPPEGQSDPATIANILTAPFWWSSHGDTEFSFRSMRRAEYWAPDAHPVVESRQLEHGGHACVELTFERPALGPGSGERLLIAVRFASDLGYYPIHTLYWRLSDDGARQRSVEISVLDTMRVDSDGNSVVVPRAIEERRFGDGDALLILTTYTLSPTAPLLLNQPIDPSRFAIDMERPGYIIHDYDTRSFRETRSTTLDQHREAVRRMTAGAGEAVERVIETPAGGRGIRRGLWIALGGTLAGIAFVGFLILRPSHSA